MMCHDELVRLLVFSMYSALLHNIIAYYCQMEVTLIWAIALNTLSGHSSVKLRVLKDLCIDIGYTLSYG